uniref:type I protein arginine methyltransferase n=1 Tax=Culicoides sonorensis TaxID=179676 RepID=A0A336LS43_CULSO
MEVDSINNDYFTSYEDLEIHELMLLDLPRTQTYRHAIETLSDLFKDKIVMDVGSGTGILSIFCAKAGAKKVFAVEASNVAKLSEKIIAANKLDHIITVFNGKVEDFQLPNDIKNVDIIVSEWMGFYLLHEGMLDSVLYARDKFLSPTGWMFPESAAIYASPCSVPTKFDSEDFEGVDLSLLAKELRTQKSHKPQIEILAPENLLHEGNIIAWIDLKEVTLEELQEFDVKEVFVTQNRGLFQGVCIWFECVFPSIDDSDPISLSTSPKEPPTHWKQTLITFPEHATEEIDEIGIPLAVQLKISRSADSPRRYNLQLEILDAEKEEHAMPCDCILTKCILTKQHLRSMQIFKRLNNAETVNGASWGSSGSAAANKACSDKRTVRRVIAAAQLSFRISRQMAPVTDEILGCQSFVMNFTLGGLNGYVSGTLISNLNVPPSYGVSGGPAISPRNSKINIQRSFIYMNESQLDFQMKSTRLSK